MKRLNAGFTAALVAALLLALVALPATNVTAQMEPSGDKFAALGTATNDNADATVSAPTGGNHLVIYGINATCETAAAMTITVVEDPGGTPATLLDVTTASTTNHTIDFRDVGLIVSDSTDIRVRLGTCGAGVDGNVTVWGQQER